MDEKRGRVGGFTVLEVIIVCIVLVTIVAIGIPKAMENRRRAAGLDCNSNLDAIFSAKEQVAFKLNVRPGGPVLPISLTELRPYLRGKEIRDSCPSGGEYTLGNLNEESGMVVVPECNLATERMSNGLTYEEAGLHIHRRSYEQDVLGRYSRNRSYTIGYPD